MKYGWKRDLPDFRDKKFGFTALDALPESIDLRPQMPPVWNQYDLGSCSSHSICGAITYDQIKNKMPDVYTPSRLFLYYQERLIEGTVNSDSGACLRDGIKTCASIGVCHENLWAYDISKFTQAPPLEAVEDASKHKILTYRSVNQDLQSLQSALASGYPIIFGITAFSSLESQEVAHTGIVPMPNPSESCLGGHAILLSGYSNEKQLFTFRNSWGETWGDSGYGYLPYAYVLDSGLASDFWLIDTTN